MNKPIIKNHYGAIYIPVAFTAAIDLCAQKFAEVAGGVTITDAQGGWIMRDGQLCRESITIVGVWFSANEAAEIRRIRNAIIRLLLQSGQEAVGTEAHSPGQCSFIAYTEENQL